MQLLSVLLGFFYNLKKHKTKLLSRTSEGRLSGWWIMKRPTFAQFLFNIPTRENRFIPTLDETGGNLVYACLRFDETDTNTFWMLNEDCIGHIATTECVTCKEVLETIDRSRVDPYGFGVFDEVKRPFWILHFNQDGSVRMVYGLHYNFKTRKAVKLCELNTDITEETFAAFRRTTARMMFKDTCRCSIS